jgi:dipeptidyl aminopeptidase/acylaminoacyl peptidase
MAWTDGGTLLLAPVASYFDWQPIVFGGVFTPSWSPVDNRIAFERNGTLAVVAATGGAPANLPASGGHNPSWSHDGSKLAYDAGGRIWILDLALSSSAPITSGSTTDMHPTWSPDGNWIAFASRRSGSSALWVVATSGGGAPIQLTSGPTSDSDPAWSPDGNSIAFTSERGGAGPHVWIASDLPDFTVAVEAETWTGMKQLYRGR